MNPRRVEIEMFNKEYCVQCFVDSQKRFSFMVDNELTVALITALWIKHGLSEETIESRIQEVA